MLGLGINSIVASTQEAGSRIAGRVSYTNTKSLFWMALEILLPLDLHRLKKKPFFGTALQSLSGGNLILTTTPGMPLDLTALRANELT